MSLPESIARAARELHTSGTAGPVYLADPQAPGTWYRWQHGTQADRGLFLAGRFVCDPPIVDLDGWREAHVVTVS